MKTNNQNLHLRRSEVFYAKGYSLPRVYVLNLQQLRSWTRCPITAGVMEVPEISQEELEKFMAGIRADGSVATDTVVVKDLWRGITYRVPKVDLPLDEQSRQLLVGVAQLGARLGAAEPALLQLAAMAS